ncbi:hypothetical protein ACTHAL_003068 [Priestia flexa]|uniref:hypothetical protein n=1 Tax=Priestia flexa TaxID=86664 RepID=UPI003F872635
MFKGLFDGWAQHRKQHSHDREYSYFDDTSFLHSSDHLNHMYNRASTNEQKSILLDYMERYEVDNQEYKGYWELSQQIKRDLGLVEKPPFTSAQQKWLEQHFKGGV